MLNDCKVVLAKCAVKHNPLNTPGWTHLRHIAKNLKTLDRQVNQAKLRAFRTRPTYRYGVEIPQTHAQAMEFDKRLNFDEWKLSVATELRQIDEHDTFTNCGHKRPPDECQHIKVKLVFDVKHDGRYEARLCARGDPTEVPMESVHSGVVSLRGLRSTLFLPELNQLETWTTDTGNACLEAVTNEKVCITAGPEFGDRVGHFLIIHKALHGLRTSGARWHDRFADCSREEGFTPCRAEPDAWMRPGNGTHEYIAAQVDDLAFSVHEPQEFTQTLIAKCGFD